MASASDAVEFLRLVVDADSHNRMEALEDLKFSYGDQWPVEIQNSRQLEARPCLTINETDAYIRQVTNAQRQQRPRIKVHAVSSTAQQKIAEIIQGLIRHTEVNSDADNAIDTAFDFACRAGVGYWRILTDYTRPDSRDQDIYWGHVENPFSVYFDPNSSEPDGSDGEKALITDLMAKAEFKRLYPGAQDSGFRTTATGDHQIEWETQEDVRLAEYFYIEREQKQLVYLSDGANFWEDQMPPPEVLGAAGVQVVGGRKSWRKKVRWCKQTETEILDERTWAGRWIPIVPVYGSTYVMDGKRRRFGLVRFAKDPQRMVNYWQTTVTELVALAPKAKWLLAEGQQEGHENEFGQANVKALPYLIYKPTTVEGQPVPPPIRTQPEPIPAGAIQNAMMASSNLQKVMGQYDPAMQREEKGPKSGAAITAEQRQSEQSNFHYYDNLTRSLKHTGRIILDLVPKVYDTQRVVRIIGDDGTPSLETINQKAEGKVLNDVTVGEYDVVMDTGPGFTTRRMESVAMMSNIMAADKNFMQVAGDLFFRNSDWPGADVIADRYAAINPLAQIDEKSDIPPAAQMKLKQQAQMIQQLQAELQKAGGILKSRQDVEEIRSHTTLLREKMVQAGEAEDRRITAAQKTHDTEVYGLTAQNVAEINALAKLLTSKTEHGHKLREMLHQFGYDSALQDRQLEAKAAEPTPAPASMQ